MTPDLPSSPLPLCVLVESATEALAAAVATWLPADTTVLVSSPAGESDHAAAAVDVAVIDCAADGARAAARVTRARRCWPSAAVVCVATGSDAQAVALLEGGADGVARATDSPEVARALVLAAARRMRVANSQLRVAFGDLVYDREASRLWCAGREVALTKRERQVFDCLFMHADRPVSVHTLQDYVWREVPSARSNPVAVYVRCLRRKLTGSRAAVVSTLRGHGYQLTRR